MVGSWSKEVLESYMSDAFLRINSVITETPCNKDEENGSCKMKVTRLLKLDWGEKNHSNKN